MPHGRKSKHPKSKPKKRRKRKRKEARLITPGFGDFRRPRRFAMRPRRAPASVLHKHSAALMLGALAEDLLTPMRPPPNWLTQRAPPFLPYDPWREHRRHTRMVDERKKQQMRREIQAEPRRAPPYASWGEIERAAERFASTGDRYM